MKKMSTLCLMLILLMTALQPIRATSETTEQDKHVAPHEIAATLLHKQTPQIFPVFEFGLLAICGVLIASKKLSKTNL